MKNVRSHLKNQQTDPIRQPVHVEDGEQGPAPTAGFSLDNRDGAHSLHGQHGPDQQPDRDQRGPAVHFTKVATVTATPGRASAEIDSASRKI